MVCGSSLFSQVLKLIDRREFRAAVKKHGTERYSKGFSSWDQCVAMLFCQLAQCHSLREICCGLASSTGKLKHLGLESAPKRSTLSYANANRSWELYETLFHSLLRRFQDEFRGTKKFRFKNKLYSLDGSLIRLCASAFPWAEYMRTKGAVKLHLLLDHDGYLPAFASVTVANESELAIARSLELPPGSIITMDRGYFDYALFRKWDDSGIRFVTRILVDNRYDVLRERELPGSSGVLADEEIRFTSKHSQKKGAPERLRLVTVWDEQNEKRVRLLTNHMGLSATTISQIYRDRWQIELFFRTLKQNMRVKSFVGTNANALQTQIWTALIGILVLKYMQHKSRQGWSMSNLAAMLRMNLVAYKDMWEWLDDPIQNPAIRAGPIEATLPFPNLDSRRGQPGLGTAK